MGYDNDGRQRQSLSTILQQTTQAQNESAAKAAPASEVPEHGRAAAATIVKYGSAAAGYIRKTSDNISSETEAQLAQIRAELLRFTAACEEIAVEIERSAEHKARELEEVTVRIRHAATSVQEVSRSYMAIDEVPQVETPDHDERLN